MKFVMSSSVIFAIVLCYVTTTEGSFMDKLLKDIKINKPKFSTFPIHTIPNIFFPTPKKFFFPTPKTIIPPIPTTNIPPPPPPPSTETPTTPATTSPPPPITTTTPITTRSSPPPSTLSEEAVLVERCQQNMNDCPWTLEELVDKIIELENIDTTAEFTGDGDPAGPVVDPNSIKEGGLTIQPTKLPGVLGAKGTSSIGSALPKQCSPFCAKASDTKQYKIDCAAYLSDTSLKWYYQRRNAMMGCFKCRDKCQLAGAIRYL